MKIVHLGGGDTVTGSCHLLQVHGLDILVDCGLAQGTDTVAPMERWPVTPGDVDYLFFDPCPSGSYGSGAGTDSQGISRGDYYDPCDKGAFNPDAGRCAGFSESEPKRSGRSC